MLGDILTQSISQAIFAPVDVNEFDLGSRQVDRGLADEDPVDIGARLHDVRDTGTADDDVVRGGRTGRVRNTESAGRVTLGVGVNNEHRQATNREARRDVHSGRRLTNTALLVRNRNDARVIGARECRALEHG